LQLAAKTTKRDTPIKSGECPFFYPFFIGIESETGYAGSDV